MTAYASTSDLATYTGRTTDEDVATRLLDRAQELIDSVTMGRIDPDNEDHLLGASQASCAQVEYWLSNNESTDLEGGVRSQTIGKTSTTFANAPSELAPRARRLLLTYGLLGGSVELL